MDQEMDRLITTLVMAELVLGHRGCPFRLEAERGALVLRFHPVPRWFLNDVALLIIHHGRVPAEASAGASESCVKVRLTEPEQDPGEVKRAVRHALLVKAEEREGLLPLLRHLHEVKLPPKVGA